jgi:tRNA(fMet)-specific endonuclease VapC
MRYMLDTNTLIYVINARPDHQAVLDRFDAEDARQLCISSITLAELRFGIEKSVRPAASRARMTRAIDVLDVAPFDAKAAESYGALRVHLERAGTPCGPLDTLIGAHALSRGLTLITSNLREFSRMPGLRLDNWIPA